MFWSGNYNAPRQLKWQHWEDVEYASLTDVLEDDDVLQDCKADDKMLIEYFTKPKILAELITLITEEPPKNVELSSQYRHASIACEVLTSDLSTLSDQLSMDVVQMNRLCDFINRDPPLNPLLASYFSRTVEMLLESSRKRDWYRNHVVCLRVLDFFKSRRDFLPNLLRHISTSAIADIFKYFVRNNSLFNKIILEWFEEYQFLESLIQIICGTYVPEPVRPAERAAVAVEPCVKHDARDHDLPEKGQQDAREKPSDPEREPPPPPDIVPENTEEKVPDPAGRGAEGGLGAEGGGGGGRVASEVGGGEGRGDEEGGGARHGATHAAAAANAAELLCDLIRSGCARDGSYLGVCRTKTVLALMGKLREFGARLLLQGMFTAPASARAQALVHGARVLQALLDEPEPLLGTAEESVERGVVELCVAPHLPLLHQALLQRPGAGGVGLPRVQVAALLARLALSEVEEVAATMITLGTPGVLVDMLFQYPHNNFLHAQTHALVKHALANAAYRTQYARHLLVECDLLTRLMDAFEENESEKEGVVRAGYMGHVVLLLRLVAQALETVEIPLPPPAAARWPAFRDDKLAPLAHRHDTPLGGMHPAEALNAFVDVTAPAGFDDAAADINPVAFEMCSADEPADLLAQKLHLEDTDEGEDAKNAFLSLARRFENDMWEDTPEADEVEAEEAEDETEEAPLSAVREVLEQRSPWESAEEGSAAGAAGAGGAEGGWAQFDAFALPDPFAPAPFAPPADPFAPAAPPAPPDDFAPFWSDASDDAGNASQKEIRGDMTTSELGAEDCLGLANKMLAFMHSMPGAADLLGLTGGDQPGGEPGTDEPGARAGQPGADGEVRAGDAGHADSSGDVKASDRSGDSGGRREDSGGDEVSHGPGDAQPPEQAAAPESAS